MDVDEPLTASPPRSLSESERRPKRYWIAYSLGGSLGRVDYRETEAEALRLAQKPEKSGFQLRIFDARKERALTLTEFAREHAFGPGQF